MSLFEAMVLGCVQGLTEFLPVSSSAHLILMPWLLSWPDGGLAFDVGLHWGTLIGVVAYFWKDVQKLTSGALQFLQGSRTWEAKLPWALALATVPGAVVGFFLEKTVESTFRQPWLIAGTLSMMGLVLFFCERFFPHERKMDSLRWSEILGIGLAQALAIVPGVSRSGATISAGLALGLARSEAARFSFLLSIPIIFGAGLLKLPEMGALANTKEFWVGCMSAAASGYMAIGFLLRYVQTKTYTPFLIYRLGMSVVIVLVYLIRL